jgi:RNA-directed DNA polymerase
VTWAKEKEKVLNENLMERVLNRDNLMEAYKRVKANGGAPGIDGMSVQAFNDHARDHWPVIADKLRTGEYLPGAIRGVSIPKPQGGERLLGIPNVQDRVIQQALSQVLSPIFEAEFSTNSYGYRPGRSAHDAIEAARDYVLSGKTWVVDIDISAFFDEVEHDRLMAKIGRKVRDKQVLKLIGRYLRAPMQRNGRQEKRVRGTPQGGPLSPLLANIYLDDLDKELERRGLSFCRYADDSVIFVGSERSGERVLESLSAWIAKHLKLRVNANKSGVRRPWNGKFLGFRINSDGRIGVAQASLDKLKDQVRRCWDAQTSLKLEERIADWQQFIRGWWNYFKICQVMRPIRVLESWIRRHMRKYFWQRWHNRRGRMNALRRLKAKPRYLAKAAGSSGTWRMARSPLLHDVLNNARLKRWGLWVPSDFATA